MPEWGYSATTTNPDITVKASARETRVSPKHATEVCKTIKGMKLPQAKTYLHLVITKRQPVPIRRHKKKVPHRHGIQKACAGRYPVKAAKEILQVLENAEANAEYKGLDTERLRIIYASAHPGMKLRRFIQRAFGRSTPRFKSLCHIELILEQTEEK